MRGVPKPRSAFAATGRADLLRAYLEGGERSLRAIAGILGYDESIEVQPTTAVFDTAPSLRPQSAEIGRETEPLAPGQYWRLETIESLSPEPAHVAPEIPVIGIEGPGRLPGPPPASRPIVSAGRLGSALRRRLRSTVPSRRVDTRRVIHRWSRGLPTGEVPRAPLAAWAPRVTVWVDRSLHLIPFWDDQDRMLRQLERLVGRTAVHEVRFVPGTAEPWFDARGRYALPPEACEWLLALTDLGFLADASRRALWIDLARRQESAGVALSAFVPCLADRWIGTSARRWRALAWERPDRSPPQGAARDPEVRLARAERLLGLLAFAFRMEPGLLRAVRKLLPAQEADAGTEADAWNHPEVAGGFSPFATLSKDLRTRLRTQFAAEGPELKRLVVKTIRAWRAGQPREIWADEVLSLASAGGLPPDALDRHEIGGAERLWEEIGQTLENPSLADPRVTQTVQAFVVRSVRERLPARAWDEDRFRPLLARAWRFAWKGPGPLPLPAGIGSAVLDIPRGEPRRGAIWQVGADLVWNPSAAPLPAGSPLAAMESSDGLATIAEEGARWSTPRPLGEGLALPRRSGQLLVLTDRTRATLGRIERPGWARAIGRDRYGLWATLAVGAARQRMRWIPPGRFRMGSPEGEPGRFDALEQTPHLVEIADGFWLGETPCTQAFWLAVMGGKNPSRFQTPDRPVEQVSWDDCQEFLGKLGQDGEAGEIWRLPTEAEWEYACRAGTETATYAGPIEIQGERNAPVLGPIAWYGGNSGVDDLDNSWDSTDWKEKEIEHTRAATHPVGRKRANPWGLYDMLGNVWEWCHDSVGPDMTLEREGPTRGIRGGSWFTSARRVRAACRAWAPPGIRHDDLGFRLARGQESALRQGAEPGGAERPSRGRPKRGTRRPGPGPRPEAAAE